MSDGDERGDESILKDAWTSTEFPHQLPNKTLTALFERADRNKLMEDTEKEKLAALPDTITVYRGLQDERARPKGLSWTLDKNMAIWFATRWKSPRAKIVTGKIKKEFVYMYTDSRSEKELVVNPAHLKILETTPIGDVVP